jgi:hypothetical protein
MWHEFHYRTLANYELVEYFGSIAEADDFLTQLFLSYGRQLEAWIEEAQPPF